MVWIVVKEDVGSGVKEMEDQGLTFLAMGKVTP